MACLANDHNYQEVTRVVRSRQTSYVMEKIEYEPAQLFCRKCGEVLNLPSSAHVAIARDIKPAATGPLMHPGLIREYDHKSDRAFPLDYNQD